MTLTLLERVHRELDKVGARLLQAEEAVAVAHNAEETAFWRNHMEQLQREKLMLREQEIILLPGQASGKHCLPRYLLSKENLSATFWLTTLS